MKLLGYARTSHRNGAGSSLPEQQASIEAWTAENDHELLDVIVDDGVSGATEDREGLALALNAVCDGGQAEGIVVLRLDRFARALHVQEAVLLKVWEAGGHVFEVEHGEVVQDDPDDPVRTFVRQIMGAVAQLERGMIRKRLRNGRRTAAQKGRYVGGGRLHDRYGYRLEPDDRGKLAYTPLKKEQAVIRRMSKLRLSGLTFRAVAERLNALHIPTPSGSGEWAGATVKRILDRESRVGQENV